MSGIDWKSECFWLIRTITEELVFWRRDNPQEKVVSVALECHSEYGDMSLLLHFKSKTGNDLKLYNVPIGERVEWSPVKTRIIDSTIDCDDDAKSLEQLEFIECASHAMVALAIAGVFPTEEYYAKDFDECAADVKDRMRRVKIQITGG